MNLNLGLVAFRSGESSRAGLLTKGDRGGTTSSIIKNVTLISQPEEDNDLQTRAEEVLVAVEALLLLLGLCVLVVKGVGEHIHGISRGGRGDHFDAARTLPHSSSIG